MCLSRYGYVYQDMVMLCSLKVDVDDYDSSLQMGQFYYSAKAFDVLERLDPNPEYWEGKRGACIGLFQQIIAGHEPRYDSCSVDLNL